MNRRIVAALVILAGCEPGVTTPASRSNTTTDVVNMSIGPGNLFDMSSTFATVLQCDPAGLTWTIQEQEANPTLWNPGVDGNVSSTGMFSAPKCGSLYVGSNLHIQSTCKSSGKTGVGTIATAQEILNVLQVERAIVSQCGETACVALDPANIQLRVCTAQEPQSTVQYYARLDFTCGPIWSPALPETMPASCTP